MPFDSRSGPGGVSRPGSRSHLDVSTQADIAHAATTYESEDENMGRRNQSSSEQGKDRRTTLYSKQEFREQYCINSKQLDLLEIEKTRKDRFLGCLSQYHIESPCSRSTNKPSFLSVCVRRRVPSDENLNLDYAPIQRYPRYAPPSPAPSELYQYDEGLECSYFRRRPRSVCSQPDPKRYTWMPEDEDCRMEWPHSILGEDVRNWQQNYNTDQVSNITRGGSLPRPLVHPCPAHPGLPPAPPPPTHGSLPHRTKHVSFARSHTLTTFDDAVAATPTAVPSVAPLPSSLTTPPAQRYRPSPGERLLDGRTKPEQMSTPQYAQYVMPLQQSIAHATGQDLLHSSGQSLVNTGGQGIVYPSGQSMIHSSGQGIVHPSGQGMVHPSGQGIVHPSGQGMVHPSGQGLGIGAMIHQYGGPVPVHFPGLVQQPHPSVAMPAPTLTSQHDHQLKASNLEKIKRGPMRTQATQTEVCLGRKPLPPNYLSLSPRTIKRVKMVAQGVQTNGFTYGINGRRLTKSFSEVGGDRLAGVGGVAGVADVENNFTFEGIINEHDKLHRTQSEEPPRSPRSPDAETIASPLYFQNEMSTLDRSPVKLSPSTMAPPNRRKSINIPTTINQQAHDYFHQNFQFIHESDRDDTMDDELPQDMNVLETSMALNQKNLEYLQKRIAEQSGSENNPRSEYSEKTALSKTTSSASQRTNYSTPFSKTSTFQSEVSTETSATTTDDSEKEKEIIIDFEPRPENETPILKRRAQKRLLQKTLSEGEILLDIRKNEILKNNVYLDTAKDAPLVMSTSQDNITSNDKDLKNEYAFYQHAPIKDEGIFKETLDPNESFSSSDGNVPFEDFHERYISYKHDMFRNRSISLEEPNSKGTEKDDDINGETTKSTPSSPQDLRQLKRSKKGVTSPDEGDSVVPTSFLIPDDRTSPFASSDSLTIDPTRDLSDGIWNESQATVLQVDSGTDNGTVISSSDLSSLAASVIVSPGNLSLLTPNSRRKHLLLLQHQQRSSMDTDALDEELDASQSQSPTSSRMKFEVPTSPHSTKPQSPPSSYLPQNVAALRDVSKQPQAKLGNGTNVTKSAPSIAITHPSIDLGDTGIKRSMSIITKKRERALSPSRRRDLQKKSYDKSDPVVKSLESPTDGANRTPAPVTENGLARTDSGKTNTTDVSESTTTTTDDYVTANSDSSKRSANRQPNHVTESRTQEGSSFESASSMYSLTRVETMEDMVVPCFSPPLPPLTTFATCVAPDACDRTVIEVPEDLHHHTVAVTTVSTAAIAPHSCTTAAILTPVLPPPRSLRPQQSRPGEDKAASSARQNSPTQNVGSKVAACMTQSVGSSSSSGSYSLTGSAANILDDIKKEKSMEHTKSPVEEITNKEQRIVRAAIPEPDRQQTVTTMKGESVSDDERSAHYSSSGYYESPVEDDEDDGGLSNITYKHSQKYRSSSRPWTTEERRRKKKAFTLEFSKSYDDSVSTSQDDWSRQSSKDVAHSYRNERSKMNTKNSLDEKSNKLKHYKHQNHSEKSKSLHSSPRDQNNGDIEKALKEEGKRCNDRYIKRSKLKNKSPTQNKTDSSARGQISDSVRRHDALCTNGKLNLNIPTSDDSSEQYKTQGTSGNGNISPRKYRRLRDSPRRKTGQTAVQGNSKSPTTPNSHRSRKNNDSNESISLPGSLPRRKSSMQAISGTSSMEAEDIDTTRILTSAGNRLTPLKYMKSPCTSPRKHKSRLDKGLADGATGGACAAAARTKAMSAESLRSVSPGSDSVFYSEAGVTGVAPCAHSHCLHCGKEVDIISADGSYGEPQPDIVQPPAGFEDSPGARAAHSNSHTPPPRPSGRYKKLEKRFRSEDKSHNDRRHHYRHRQEVRAKSEERSKEVETTRSDMGRIARSAGTGLDKLGPGNSTASIDNDDGSINDGSGEGADERGVYATPYWCGAWLYVADEDEFRAWQRHDREDETSVNSRCAEGVAGGGGIGGLGSASDSEADFARRYQALTLRLVHRKACVEMYRRQANGTFQSDKCVVVRRRGDEFGFRIHGSKPVVVSAIEADTPAETSGLEVGDIIIAVNGINVLDKSHSEVVKIAHAGSEILELEVARTCDVVASLAGDTGAPALFSGYLWRQVPAAPVSADGTPPAPRWHRRWFCLKRDNCLYYYKSDSSLQPVGALMLINYSVSRWPAEEAGRAHGLRVQRSGGAGLCLAADNEEAATRWLAVISHAIEQSAQRDGWLDATIRHMKLPPSSVPRPDCFGYLMKLGSQWKSWSKRYCVLKDACLYFYHDATSKSAFGMACLHGYRVAACNPAAAAGGKKHALELTPQQHKQRHFYFHAESDMDKKRWLAALEYSIDRWMKAS